jgi:cobalt-zinc-cadmium efflux system outer membrane protein
MTWLVPVVSAYAQVAAPSPPWSSTSLTVSGAIRRALESNPRVAAAAAEVRAADGARRTARTWPNPTFTYQYEGAAAVGDRMRTDVERQVSAYAMVPLEPIYQLGPRKARAESDVRAATADQRTARRQLALDVVRAYYQVGIAQVTANTALDVQGWLDSLLVYTRIRVNEGATAELDLVRLEVESARATSELALARVDLIRAREDLRALLGTDSVGILPVDSTGVSPMPSTLPSLPSLIAAARTRRPELQGTEARLHSADAARRLERSMFIRDVGAMAGIMSMNGMRSLMAGFSVPLPVFDQNRGEVQRADAARAVAIANGESVDRMVVAEVTAAHGAVQTLSERATRLPRDLLDRAAEGRRLIEGAYREGAAPLIQVLDATRAYAEAQQAYYRTLFAQQQSVIELNAAIGAEDVLVSPIDRLRIESNRGSHP